MVTPKVGATVGENPLSWKTAEAGWNLICVDSEQQKLILKIS